MVHGGLLVSGIEDVPTCPDIRDRDLDWVLVDAAGLHLSHLQIPAAVELDELKELYKKKTIDFET